LPPPDVLAGLRAQLTAGYVRGIRAELDRIAEIGAAHHDFVDQMRGHAARLDLDAMTRLIDTGATHATSH